MNNKLVLIALFALFFAPMLVAVVLHSEWVDWQAAPEKAHGELIEPVIPLGEFKHADPDGTRHSLADLLDRWHLVYLKRQPCRDECVETATLMHNIRLAQDRHRDEVGLVMVSTRGLSPETRRRITDLDPTWLLLDNDAGRTLAERLPKPVDGTLFIVDPKANIMERFGPGANLNDVRMDLDRLLTWTLRKQQ